MRKVDGETLDKNNPLFREKYRFGLAKPHPIGMKSLSQLMLRVTKNAGVRGQKDGQRYDTQINHGFRKRFNTILKLNNNISPAVTEKLMGHKMNLDRVYMTPTKEELFEGFRKAILDLTIDDSERLRMKNKKLEEDKSQLEKKNEELQIALKKVDELWADKQRMESSKDSKSNIICN